jgi:hypothetical protein
VSGITLAAVAVLNRRFYALLWRRGGWRLTGLGFMLHVLYFAYSSASLAYAALERRMSLASPRRASRTGTP